MTRLASLDGSNTEVLVLHNLSNYLYANETNRFAIPSETEIILAVTPINSTFSHSRPVLPTWGFQLASKFKNVNSGNMLECWWVKPEDYTGPKGEHRIYLNPAAYGVQRGFPSCCGFIVINPEYIKTTYKPDRGSYFNGNPCSKCNFVMGITKNDKEEELFRRLNLEIIQEFKTGKKLWSQAYKLVVSKDLDSIFKEYL